jgi:hypothetical protein
MTVEDHASHMARQRWNAQECLRIQLAEEERIRRERELEAERIRVATEAEAERRRVAEAARSRQVSTVVAPPCADA